MYPYLSRVVHGIGKRIYSSFKLDKRAIGIFRILLAVLILIDLTINASSLYAFFVDQGIVPVAIVQSSFYRESLWSLHLHSSSHISIVGLFILNYIFAILLLIGFRTRLAIIICWILLYSLQMRNPMIISGGDVLLRVITFWGMFLPLGARYSVDSRGGTDTSHTYFSTATLGFIVQLMLMYLFSAALKDHPVRVSEFTATYYALSLDVFVTPLGRLLHQHFELMVGMTMFVFYLEKFGSYIYLIPRKSQIFKTLAVLLFISFHAGLIMTMHIGMFPWTAIVAWILLLPKGIRDRLETHKALPPQKYVTSIAPHRLHRIWQLIAGLTIVYVVCWNIRTLDFERHVQRFPSEINHYGQVLGLGQYRYMFSPRPLTDDGWRVVQGYTEYGQQVHIPGPGHVETTSKPAYYASYFPNDKRRKFLLNLRQDNVAPYRELYALYLCRQRNKHNKEQLNSVSLTYMLEKTLDDYVTEPLTAVDFGTYMCE